MGWQDCSSKHVLPFQSCGLLRCLGGKAGPDSKGVLTSLITARGWPRLGTPIQVDPEGDSQSRPANRGRGFPSFARASVDCRRPVATVTCWRRASRSASTCPRWPCPRRRQGASGWLCQRQRKTDRGRQSLLTGRAQNSIEQAWRYPAARIAAGNLPRDAAVGALTHDATFDIPVLDVALRHGFFLRGPSGRVVAARPGAERWWIRVGAMTSWLGCVHSPGWIWAGASPPMKPHCRSWRKCRNPLPELLAGRGCEPACPFMRPWARWHATAGRRSVCDWLLAACMRGAAAHLGPSRDARKRPMESAQRAR